MKRRRPPGPATAASAPPATAGGWWWRFLGWAVLLSIPCWFLAEPCHAFLRSAASFALGVGLSARPSGPIEVQATHALGIFAAMCLASARAPLGRRLAAVAIGLPVLLAIELVTGIAAIQTELFARGGHPLPDWALAARDQALTAPPWLAVPLVWLLLLGRVQLRPAAPATR